MATPNFGPLAPKPVDFTSALKEGFQPKDPLKEALAAEQPSQQAISVPAPVTVPQTDFGGPKQNTQTWDQTVNTLVKDKLRKEMQDRQKYGVVITPEERKRAEDVAQNPTLKNRAKVFLSDLFNGKSNEDAATRDAIISAEGALGKELTPDQRRQVEEYVMAQTRKDIVSPEAVDAKAKKVAGDRFAAWSLENPNAEERVKKAKRGAFEAEADSEYSGVRSIAESLENPLKNGVLNAMVGIARSVPGAQFVGKKVNQLFDKVAGTDSAKFQDDLKKLDEEFLRDKTSETVANISAGLPLYAAGGKLAETALTKIPQYAKFAAKFPVFANAVVQGGVEEGAEYGIRKTAGEDYTIGDALSSWALGAGLSAGLSKSFKGLSPSDAERAGMWMEADLKANPGAKAEDRIGRMFSDLNLADKVAAKKSAERAILIDEVSAGLKGAKAPEIPEIKSPEPELKPVELPPMKEELPVSIETSSNKAVPSGGEAPKKPVTTMDRALGVDLNEYFKKVAKEAPDDVPEHLIEMYNGLLRDARAGKKLTRADADVVKRNIDQWRVMREKNAEIVRKADELAAKENVAVPSKEPVPEPVIVKAPEPAPVEVKAPEVSNPVTKADTDRMQMTYENNVSRLSDNPVEPVPEPAPVAVPESAPVQTSIPEPVQVSAPEPSPIQAAPEVPVKEPVSDVPPVTSEDLSNQFKKEIGAQRAKEVSQEIKDAQSRIIPENAPVVDNVSTAPAPAPVTDLTTVPEVPKAQTGTPWDNIWNKVDFNVGNSRLSGFQRIVQSVRDLNGIARSGANVWTKFASAWDTVRNSLNVIKTDVAGKESGLGDVLQQVDGEANSIAREAASRLKADAMVSFADGHADILADAAGRINAIADKLAERYVKEPFPGMSLEQTRAAVTANIRSSGLRQSFDNGLDMRTRAAYDAGTVLNAYKLIKDLSGKDIRMVLGNDAYNFVKDFDNLFVRADFGSDPLVKGVQDWMVNNNLLKNVQEDYSHAYVAPETVRAANDYGYRVRGQQANPDDFADGFGDAVGKEGAGAPTQAFAKEKNDVTPFHSHDPITQALSYASQVGKLASNTKKSRIIKQVKAQSPEAAQFLDALPGNGRYVMQQVFGINPKTGAVTKGINQALRVGAMGKILGNVGTMFQNIISTPLNVLANTPWKELATVRAWTDVGDTYKLLETKGLIRVGAKNVQEGTGALGLVSRAKKSLQRTVLNPAMRIFSGGALDNAMMARAANARMMAYLAKNGVEPSEKSVARSFSDYVGNLTADKRMLAEKYVFSPLSEISDQGRLSGGAIGIGDVALLNTFKSFARTTASSAIRNMNDVVDSAYEAFRSMDPSKFANKEVAGKAANVALKLGLSIMATDKVVSYMTDNEDERKMLMRKLAGAANLTELYTYLFGHPLANAAGIAKDELALVRDVISSSYQSIETGKATYNLDRLFKGLVAGAYNSLDALNVPVPGLQTGNTAKTSNDGAFKFLNETFGGPVQRALGVSREGAEFNSSYDEIEKLKTGEGKSLLTKLLEPAYRGVQAFADEVGLWGPETFMNSAQDTSMGGSFAPFVRNSEENASIPMPVDEWLKTNMQDSGVETSGPAFEKFAKSFYDATVGRIKSDNIDVGNFGMASKDVYGMKAPRYVPGGPGQMDMSKFMQELKANHPYSYHELMSSVANYMDPRNSDKGTAKPSTRSFVKEITTQNANAERVSSVISESLASAIQKRQERLGAQGAPEAASKAAKLTDMGKAIAAFQARFPALWENVKTSVAAKLVTQTENKDMEDVRKSIGDNPMLQWLWREAARIRGAIDQNVKDDNVPVETNKNPWPKETKPSIPSKPSSKTGEAVLVEAYDKKKKHKPVLVSPPQSKSSPLFGKPDDAMSRLRAIMAGSGRR